MSYQSQRQQKAVLPHNIKTIRQDEILSNSHKTKIIFTDLKASVYKQQNFVVILAACKCCTEMFLCFLRHYTWVQGIAVFLLFILSPLWDEMYCLWFFTLFLVRVIYTNILVCKRNGVRNFIPLYPVRLSVTFLTVVCYCFTN